MVHRLINPLKSNSFFLFGARGTGKSTLLKTMFTAENALWFDLLDPELEDKFQRHPKLLTEQILAEPNPKEWVVIDEIQKCPLLLNQVHQLVESTPIKFALTGSSARKLKHGSANLLAGRAFMNEIFPLTAQEIGEDFILDEVLRFGSLPKMLHLQTDLEKQEFLRAYALTYLKEEIWNEHLVRNLDPFRRFLEIAAQANSQIINYTNIARDVGADSKTVQTYFELLNDTLLGFFLEPYHPSIRKQQRQSPKFYFFDLGVTRALARLLNESVTPSTYGYGKAFEHFLITEIYRLNTYLRKDWKLSYLLTKDKVEIDLIIEQANGKTILIEIKSAEHVDERHTQILEHFLGDFPRASAFVLSKEAKAKKIGNVTVLPWQEALQMLAD